MRIGLISDTHGYIHPRLFHYLSDCDEVWHAGDIGSEEVLKEITAFKTLRAVYGNIDGQKIRKQLNEDLYFTVDQVKVCMTHIGGYPGKYDKRAFLFVKTHQPQIFICGHSHILKVQYDNPNQWLFLNPGAAGNYGWHKMITLLKFEIEAERIFNMQAVELGQRGVYVAD